MKEQNQCITTAKLVGEKALSLLQREPKKVAIAAAITATVTAGSAVAAIALITAAVNGFGSGDWESHDLVDQNGPGGQMTAATLSTPSGWTVQGGVHWHNPNDATDPYKMSFTALSPDGKLRVEMFPAQSWGSGSGTQGFARRGSAETAESVVRNLFAPKLRPGARIVSVERDAEEQAKLTEAMRARHSSGPGMAPGNRMGIDAVVAVLEYEENGQRYEERVLSVLQSVESSGDPQSRMMLQQMGGQAPPAVRFNYSQVITLRAPAGELEAATPTLEKIADSLKREEKWQMVVANYHRGKSNQHFRESRKRLVDSHNGHQRRMAERQRSFDNSQAIYRDGQAANDANHRNWLNGHLGQADFHNPHTGQIETHIDHGGRTWQDGSGNTFQTETWQDDPRNSPDNWGRGIEEMNRIRY